MSYPKAKEPELAEELDRIAKANGVSVLGTGINPGLIMDLLVLIWTGCMEDVEHIVSRRVNSLSPFGPAVMDEQGIGISKEFLPRLFEPFERERTSTVSGIQGTGLGMSITKNLAELMHGRITVESQQGRGSTFTFTFPFRFGEAPDSRPVRNTAASSQLLAGRHILLVEDNDLNQEIAATILEEAGCTVDVASDGAEAVEKVRKCAENPYDLVLMDIQMPVLDGIEATKIIRAMEDSRLARLPIVAMTANAFEEDRQRVLSAGMNGHLGKPIDVGKLFDVLQNVLNTNPVNS